MIYVVDAREIDDPDRDKDLQDHMGYHPETLRRVAEHPKTVKKMQQICSFLDKYKDQPDKKCLIVNVCVAGRHRSEALRLLTVGGLEFHGAIADTRAIREPIWRNYGCKWKTCAHCNLQDHNLEPCFIQAARQLHESEKRE